MRSGGAGVPAGDSGVKTEQAPARKDEVGHGDAQNRVDVNLSALLSTESEGEASAAATQPSGSESDLSDPQWRTVHRERKGAKKKRSGKQKKKRKESERRAPKVGLHAGVGKGSGSAA